MELRKVKLTAIKPYPNNPRYNDEAMGAVEESIDQVGYISPIIVDENLEILAGHTRWRALDSLCEDEVDVIVIPNLTEEKKRKFRLLDNKTAELSKWDYDLLLKELEDLDFGDFGFWDKELEKMGDNLLNNNGEKKKRKKKPVICPRCGKVVNGLVDMDSLEDD